VRQELRGTATATTSASASLDIIPPKARAESASDQPTRSDSIGFKPYVDALAQFLMNEKTAAPLTVSLEGEWGSGKSSFLRQLRDAVGALAKKRGIKEPLVVPFNAWRHDKDEALWASFAVECARSIAPRSFTGRAWRALVLGWRRLGREEWRSVLVISGVVFVALSFALLFGVLVHGLFFPRLKSDAHASELELWIDYVARWAPRVVPTTFVLSLLAKVVKLAPSLNLSKYLSAAPDYKAKVGFLERFHEDFAIFAKTYVDGRRTFVFVDDLDRCEVPKAAELLQALNLMLAGDLPFIIVLAMDRLKIAAGVALRHKDLLEFLPPLRRDAGERQPPSSEDKRSTGIAYGYEFIEKFVQLPLRVPRLTQDGLPRFLDDLLNTPRSSSTEGNAIADPEDVVASDGTLTSTQAVTVSVSDVAPAISSGAVGSVTEGAAADQLVDDVGSPPLHDCGGPLALIV